MHPAATGRASNIVKSENLQNHYFTLTKVVTTIPKVSIACLSSLHRHHRRRRPEVLPPLQPGALQVSCHRLPLRRSPLNPRMFHSARRHHQHLHHLIKRKIRIVEFNHHSKRFLPARLP